ncbi:MAG TPA: hypothetical protein VFA68_21220 [Terriglobales bacterium]|nr:hypothetical protein [Terriglobales bacterium]
MKSGNTIRILVTAGLLSLGLCQAQELQGWHLRSTIGFDWSRDSFNSISSTFPENSTPAGSIGGEVGMDLSGIVMDPKFLTFDSNFNFSHNAISTGATDYGDGLLSGGINLSALPGSHYPLEVYYQRSGADTNGDLFGSNTNTAQFRVRETLDFRNVPHIVLAYNQNSNDVKLVTSLTDTSYKQSDVGIQANDRTAGWSWNAGFNVGKFDSTAIGDLALAGDTHQDYRTLDARAYRSLFSGKGVLSSDFYKQHYSFDFPGTGTSLTDSLLLSESLMVQHTEKLSTHYSYSLSRQSVVNDFTPAPGGLTVLNLPALNSHTVSTGVDYQWFKPIRVFETVRYDRLSPFSDTFESQTSYLQSSSGVTLQKRFRGFDVNATYAGQFQRLGTNLENFGNTFSSNVDARIGWGDVKKLHVAGTYRYNRLNFVQQLGGFTRYKIAGVEAETTRFWGVRLRGGVEHGSVDILNISGDTSRSYNNVSFALESRRYQFMASRGMEDGAGSIFPNPLIGQFFIATPLPVSQLIGTPLLNRNTTSTNFSFTGRPKNNLQITAFFRKENDLLFSSTQDYRLWEVRGQYNIGRISIDAGVGNIRTTIDQQNNLSGLAINRYWFRIRRTFNFF